MTGIEKHWFESAKGWESTWNEDRREGVRVEWFDNGQKWLKPATVKGCAKFLPRAGTWMEIRRMKRFMMPMS